MRALLRRVREDQAGATAIEYGLLATMIALVIIGGLTMISGSNNNKYNAVSGAITNSM